MPETTFATLEEYAEHVRIEAFRLTAALCRELGPEHAASQRAAALCTEAANLVNGRQMEEERAEVDELDLATLPPVFPNGQFDPFGDE